jgi:hypothetical protein
MALAKTQIEGRFLGSEDRPNHQDGDHDDSYHGKAVAAETDQGPLEWGHFAGDWPSGRVGAGQTW